MTNLKAKEVEKKEGRRGILQQYVPQLFGFGYWAKRLVILKDGKLKAFPFDSDIPTTILNFELFKCQLRESDSETMTVGIGETEF